VIESGRKLQLNSWPNIVLGGVLKYSGSSNSLKTSFDLFLSMSWKSLSLLPKFPWFFNVS
jgi:hypothetical protein